MEEIARLVEGDLLLPRAARPRRAIHDSRLVLPGDVFVALPGQRTQGELFLADAFQRGACGAIVASKSDWPARAHNVVVVRDAVAALHKLASAWRQSLSATLVGVTGSNGKTTVKALLGHLLTSDAPTFVAPHNYNTEIGLPISLLSMPEEARFGVFELGAEKPGDIRTLTSLLRPDLGIITSVGPSHLDGFATLDAVAEEKWSLLEGLSPSGIAVLNADSDPLLERAKGERRPILSAGMTSGEIRGRLVQSVPELVIHLEQQAITLRCPLLGAHNANNVLVAAGAASVLGMFWPQIRSRAATFQPIEHRLRPVSVRFGTVLDDTYNANPASMAAALRVLSEYAGDTQSKAFIFGEMRGLGAETDRYHREVLDLALSLPIDVILPVGEAAVAACRQETSRIVIVPRDQIHALVRRFPPSSTVLLVKGSRALKLETVVDALRENG